MPLKAFGRHRFHYFICFFEQTQHMEAKENSQQTSIFDNMVIAPKSQKHNFEIHIHSDQSTLAQR
jgi:hypothetical protein